MKFGWILLLGFKIFFKVAQAYINDLNQFYKILKDIHYGRPFQCEVCGLAFNEQFNLKKHFDGVHLGRKGRDSKDNEFCRFGDCFVTAV